MTTYSHHHRRWQGRLALGLGLLMVIPICALFTKFGFEAVVGRTSRLPPLFVGIFIGLLGVGGLTDFVPRLLWCLWPTQGIETYLQRLAGALKIGLCAYVAVVIVLVYLIPWVV